MSETPRKLVSIVTPAFNESANLPVLHDRIAAVFAGLPAYDYEWIVVDDHSADSTFSILTDLNRTNPRVRGHRLSRNSGSHAAISCGLERSRGSAAVVLAADLQDPPEMIPELLERWSGGAQVVWAARRRREGESRGRLLFASLYYFLMRKIIGLSDMPAEGADYFLLDRAVVDAVARFEERNASLLALITWMGFRQVTLEYDKQGRLHGTSGWTLRKKVRLLIDSITSFSYLPIRIMSCIGFLTALAGLVYAVLIVVRAFSGQRPEGWASLMVVMLTLGGMQMLLVGMIGEYLWRTLEESRRRPRYLIEASTPAPPPNSPAASPLPSLEAPLAQESEKS